MKGKELIRQLQEEDPSGELEVCVGNLDIHFVSREPAYYDGCLQVLKRDENNKFYNIIGAELRSTGDKIQIHELSVRIALLENPDLPVEYDEYSERHCKEKVESWRKETLEIIGNS